MTGLVTGASRGIGKTIALELAGLGYNLAITGRDKASLGQAASEIEATGVKCLCIEADLGEESSYDKVVDETVKAFGGIDLLVNCAGLSHAGPFHEATPELWDRIFRVNAKAPFFISKAALPYLKKSEKPIVINIASVVGFKGLCQPIRLCILKARADWLHQGICQGSTAIWHQSSSRQPRRCRNRNGKADASRHQGGRAHSNRGNSRNRQFPRHPQGQRDN